MELGSFGFWDNFEILSKRRLRDVVEWVKTNERACDEGELFDANL